jgi:hypothetical protein
MAASDITTTALSYLDATSSIQTQLNGKQVTITGAATTIVADNLTANRVAISNGAGKMAASDITTTALSYLDATSSIQTQLNGKIGGSGTANYHPKWLTATTQGNSIVFDNGTNVGIGTETPVSLLDVRGTPITGYEERINALFVDPTDYGVGVGGGIGFRGKYNSAGDYETFGAIKGVKYNAVSGNREGALQFQTNTDSVMATIMTLTSRGSVGIGVTNPQAGLHVSGSIISNGLTASRAVVTDADKKLVSSGVTATENSYLSGVTSSIQTQLNGKIGGSITANYIAKGAGTGTLQNSTIYDNGTNIGIGTTSPATRLHIHGTGTQLFRITDDNAAVMTLGISNDTGPFMVMIDAAGTPQIWLSSYGSSYIKGLMGVGVEPSYQLDVSTGANTDIIGRFYGANQSAEYLAFGIQTGTAIITAGHAGSGNNALVIKTSLSGTESEKMRITSDGKIGIGTESPLTDVEIRPQTGTNVKLTITGDKSISAVGDEYCSVDFRSGGDTSPQSDNDIVGRIVSVAEHSNGSRSGMAFYTTGGASAPYIKERVRIDNYGNVGIGTGNPLKRLDVSEGNDVGIIIGADIGSTARTAVANRFAALGFLHYTATQEPVAGLFANVTSSLNQVCIGGGTSAVNAATSVEIYTAGNTTTPTGTSRLTVDSNGKVGIATSSSPLGRLDISDGGITIVGGADDSATTRTANTTANFRMGSLHYDKTEDPVSVFLATNSVDDNSLRIGGGSTMMNAATNITFYTAANTATPAGTERMRIMPNGTIYMYNLGTGGATDLNIGADGEIIRATSSRRFKENVRPLDFDSSILLQFKPVRFNWLNNETVATSVRGSEDYGFIAEQIADVFPEMVNYRQDGTVQSWKTQKMLVLAIAEIQRQNGRIDALEKHIHQLQEAKNG